MSDYSPLKAYAVLEDGDNTGDIYFARHAITARKDGANEYASGDITGVTCRRAPWADQYAPGPVPFAAKFEHGWWIECDGCGQTIRDGDSDDEGNPINFDITQDGHYVYCTPACHAGRLREKEEEREFKAVTVDLLKAELLRKIPSANITDHEPHVFALKTDGVWQARQATISFEIPNSRFGFAQFQFDEPGTAPHVTVPAGDHDAFNAWRDAGYPEVSDPIKKSDTRHV